MPPLSLTPEEQFLWRLARDWRGGAPLAGDLDWARVVEMALHNRMAVLLHDHLAAYAQLDHLPPGARVALQERVDLMRGRASLFGSYLARYLRAANGAGVPTVAFKGLSLSINVYGNAAMRPGGDIDILVRHKDVAAAMQVLEGIGVGAFWPNLMHDAYYGRHHLHQQRSTPDLAVWFEIHWALDHPLTLQTVDYERMLARASAGTLLGEPVRELTHDDHILALAIHLVKHAVYLPATIDHLDLARILLADGMLMYLLDIAEIIKQHAAGIAWERLIDSARAWGMAEGAGAVLRASHMLLAAPVPAAVLRALPAQPPRPLVRRVMRRVVEHQVDTYLGQPPDPFWAFLLSPNGAFILRPIRLLDLATYAFPPADYLRRRYGGDGPAQVALHLLRAMGQYARVGVDTLFFTLERYVRMKRQGLNASFFNRLDSAG